MLDWIRQWIARHLSPVPSELGDRLGQADSWIEELPIAEARSLASQVLETPSWFECEPGDATALIPQDVPITVFEFFRQYRAVRGRFCDLTLVASDVSPSDVSPQFLRIGWQDGHTELCVVAGDHRVHRLANDVPPDEAAEETVPSVYHAVVWTAAVLEYLPIPSRSQPPN